MDAWHPRAHQSARPGGDYILVVMPGHAALPVHATLLLQCFQKGGCEAAAVDVGAPVPLQETDEWQAYLRNQCRPAAISVPACQGACKHYPNVSETERTCSTVPLQALLTLTHKHVCIERCLAWLSEEP